MTNKTRVARITAAIGDEDKRIGLVGYHLTDEQVEKIVCIVLAAADVAMRPDEDRAISMSEARHLASAYKGGDSNHPLAAHRDSMG